jgi:hypothetical protein
LIGRPGNELGVVAFNVVRDRIVRIDIVADASKLARIASSPTSGHGEDIE